MYQVLIRRREDQPRFNEEGVATLCDASYLRLRSDMQLQGMRLSEHPSLGEDNMSFYITAGEPTAEFRKRLEEYGESRIICLTGDFQEDLKLGLDAYVDLLPKEEKERFLDQASRVVDSLRKQ